MNIGLDEQGFNSPRLQNLRRSEHAVGDSGTRLRNPQLHRRSVDLISDALPFGKFRYAEPNALSNAIGYAQSMAVSEG